MSDQYTPTGGQTIFPRINFLNTFESRFAQRAANGRIFGSDTTPTTDTTIGNLLFTLDGVGINPNDVQEVSTNVSSTLGVLITGDATPTYTWAVETGSGTITGSGNTIDFTGTADGTCSISVTVTGPNATDSPQVQFITFLSTPAPVAALELDFANSLSLVDSVSGNDLVTFTRASIGTYVDSSGVVQTAAADTPRFDHDPATGKSLGLLIEESRTNLFLNSAALATQSVASAASEYALSFYGTGTVVLSGTATGTLVGTGANERVSLVVAATAGSITATVTGTVENAQLEKGPFPTSFIPTTGAAATRAQDLTSITGTNFSSWYNQSEGTVVTKMTDNGEPNTAANRVICYLGTGASNGNNRIITTTGASLGAYVATVGVQALITGGWYTKEVETVGAFAFKQDDFALATDGVIRGTDNSGGVPTCDRLYLFMNRSKTNTLCGHFSRLTYYNTRLADQLLTDLTS